MSRQHRGRPPTDRTARVVAGVDDGFTLLEILIAIVLVGVLSAVALVGIGKLVSKGSDASCQASSDAATTAAAAYFAAHDGYPATLVAMTTASGSGAATITPALVLGPGVRASGLVATSDSGGWTMTMTPGTSTAAPTFSCGVAGRVSTLASTWPALPAGQVGVGFSTTGIPATGGVPPYAWSAAMPRGLTIGPVSGTVYGTPTEAGTFPVTVTITDAASASVSRAYSMVVAPTIAVCPTTFVGWRGEYFGNTTLTGPPAMCRDDAAVSFDWGWGAPAAVLPSDGFSVRWTRTERLVAGTYTFVVGSDDGSRLAVDGTVVLDRWADQTYPAVPPSVTLALAAGDHVMTMEYYERVGPARATLSWATAAAGTVVCSATPTGWLGEYFANGTLTGPPVACRDDVAIDMDWGAGPPIAGMPSDVFSARWTKTVSVAAGAYTFTMGSDDGSRLFVDGVLVLDDWSDHGYPATPRRTTATLSAGPHTVVMEYYERTGGALATLAIAPAG